MSLTRDQADWIRLCGVGQLSDNQQVLLETVLAACDPESVLTRHVAGAQTAVAAVARAQSALESRARPSRRTPQPYAKPTLGLVSTALEMIESMGLVLPSGALDGPTRTLRAIKIGGEVGLKDPADCKDAATRLAAQAIEVRTAVADHFEAAWQGAMVTDAAERLAVETAALCVIEGRWHPLLTDDVRTALSRGPIDADRLMELLLPAKRDFQVAVVIEGTSWLESVAGLMSPAAAPTGSAPGEPLSNWGHHKADLKALGDLAKAASDARRNWSGDQASGYMLLNLTVCARDLGSAALLGRRHASESLDQYVAGQRLAEIRLRPETLACDLSSGRTLRLAVPVLGAGPVRPLTTSWPPALRESLRTAHIARVTEAPMTAAGLCWAALEALEVKSGSTAMLARALSLQAVRQQAVDLHQRTRTAVAAKVRATRVAYRAAQSRFASLVPAAALGEKVVALEQKVAAARATAFDRHVELERALEAEAQYAAVDVWARGKDGGKLRDLDRWLDVLAAPTDAEPELRVAANALAVLTDSLGGEASLRLRAWRALMATPESLAEWIEDIAGRFEKSLDGLYALRNTALHDGQFTSPTDMLDVHAGRGLVDLTLEFLGNWYGHVASTTPERAAWTAMEVIDHLAERQQKVVAALRGGARGGLNVTHLTSPTSTGQDRA